MPPQASNPVTVGGCSVECERLLPLEHFAEFLLSLQPVVERAPMAVPSKRRIGFDTEETTE